MTEFKNSPGNCSWQAPTSTIPHQPSPSSLSHDLCLEISAEKQTGEVLPCLSSADLFLSSSDTKTPDTAEGMVKLLLKRRFYQPSLVLQQKEGKGFLWILPQKFEGNEKFGKWRGKCSGSLTARARSYLTKLWKSIKLTGGNFCIGRELLIYLPKIN